MASGRPHTVRKGCCVGVLGAVTFLASGLVPPAAAAERLALLGDASKPTSLRLTPGKSGSLQGLLNLQIRNDSRRNGRLRVVLLPEDAPNSVVLRARAIE